MNSGTWDPVKMHSEVSNMYSWQDVARRTDEVYQRVMDLDDVCLAERFERYHTCGPVAGKFAVMIIAVNHMLWMFLEWLWPRENIDIAPSFDQTLFEEELKRIRKSQPKR
jgi:phosphatidylinositol N-acetylglucosaminyltransferase subunit A